MTTWTFTGNDVRQIRAGL